MSPDDLLALLLAASGGGLLGAIYFFGLWWTVRRSVTSRHPALLFLASLLVRMGVLLGGLFLVGQGHWQRLVACLAGVLLARLLVTGLIRTGERGTRVAPEAADAP